LGLKIRILVFISFEHDEHESLLYVSEPRPELSSWDTIEQISDENDRLDKVIDDMFVLFRDWQSKPLKSVPHLMAELLVRFIVILRETLASLTEENERRYPGI
jgi:hypothetical protein